jgi:hypothetical protein
MPPLAHVHSFRLELLASFVKRSNLLKSWEEMFSTLFMTLYQLK